MFGKIKKRFVSGLSALAVMAGNVSPWMPITIGSETAETAHKIAVFDIDLKAGADYYPLYEPENPAEDGQKSLSDVYVWQADNPNEGHKFIYNIKFSISGEGTTDDVTENGDTAEAVGNDFIEIRIPAHILKCQGDETAGQPDSHSLCPDEAELPVPSIEQLEYKSIVRTDEDGNLVTEKEYILNHPFVYKYDADNDEYIIYNIQPVSAGIVYELPVAYRMTKNTWEYQDLGKSAPCQASVTVHSWEKNGDPEENKIDITMKSREIPVYIDTGATLESTVKRADSSKLMSAAEIQNKTDFTFDDITEADKYQYIIWSVTSKISDVTQKYSLNLTDQAAPLTGTDGDGIQHTIDGEVIAVKLKDKNYQNANEISTSGLTAPGVRVDYVITKYLKEEIEKLSALPKPGIYSISNTAAVELTPNDGQDNQKSCVSTAAFRFEIKDPVFIPIEIAYSGEKYGLYNGNNRVRNKNNISSYELAKLSEGKSVSGLKYQTNTSAYAYGKTIENLASVLTGMVITYDPNQNGNVTITAGTRKYEFNSDNTDSYFLTIGDDSPVEIPINDPAHPYEGSLSLLDMQRIAAKEIADDYYGQKALEYIFDDKNLTLKDKDITQKLSSELDKDDYKIDSVAYSYTVKMVDYDYDTMTFSARNANAEFSETEDYNILEFNVYLDGSEEAESAGTYHIRTGEANIIRPDLIKSLTNSEVIFSETANVTGYQIKTKNLYFYVELKTTPSITLKPSPKLMEIVQNIMEDETQSEKKIAIQNDAFWKIMHDEIPLKKEQITGIDYIADIVRTSNISKKALGEKITFKGQDGKIYQSINDTLSGQYELAWQSRIAETANGIEVNGEIKNNVPVEQSSGIFYDLLPAHCDIIEDSVNVYIDSDGDVNENTPPLSPSAFEVQPRIDNYHGSGKKLLKIIINAPCNVSYTVTYVTVHSHADIQDYGSIALNTVAYQTGNADIGNGFPDDGGNQSVTMTNYIKNLDPDNGNAKRFIYAEATEDILALFPTLSGVYKKVSTRSDPTFRRSGTVLSGETYTYSIRMLNDSSTKTRDIAIIDSVENYRTANGIRFNYGLNQDRGWYGTILSFDLSDIEDKMSEYISSHQDTKAKMTDLKLILYVGDDPKTDIVNLDGSEYSDSQERKYLLHKILDNTAKAEEMAAELTDMEKIKYDAIAGKWKCAEDWRNLDAFDMSEVTAFIVYTGEYFVLSPGGSIAFTVKMQAPPSITTAENADVQNGVFLTPPATYNNIYRSFVNFDYKEQDDSNKTTYFYTHYDYTQLQYRTAGNLEFLKIDSDTKTPIEGVGFNLSGTSDYGTIYDKTVYSDNFGYVSFKNLERGTYQLIETKNDPDHLPDTTPRTVRIEPNGETTVISIDGCEISQNQKYIIENIPRYHGNFEFKKVDSLTQNGISNTTFKLTGISEYNTSYSCEATSDANGTVSFGDIEKGQNYTLTEIITTDDYIPPEVRVYRVKSVGDRELTFQIEGENAVKIGDEYQIKNIPFAEMNLQKVDSITKRPLNGAVFTLTADETLNNEIQNINTRLSWEKKSSQWVQQDNQWVQTVGNGSSAVGEYLFKNLLPGTYTLEEITAPDGFDRNTTKYTIEVSENADKKKYIITFNPDNDIEYIRLENDDFTTADENTAQYYRILNDQTYEKNKTIIKSWIGGTGKDGTFPILHLSSENLEASAVKTTIDKDKFKAIATSSMTSFERSELPPAGSSTDAKDSNYPDETGSFKIWQDETDETKVYWWSDANIIYLPDDCEGLFRDCTDITNLDFTSFYVDRVKSMENMFLNCKKLKEIKFNNKSATNFKNGHNIKTLKSMFEGCSDLMGVNLQYLTTTSILTDTSGMFRNCSRIASINITGLDTSAVTDMRYMFGMENGKENKSLTNLDTSHLTAGNALKYVDSMFKNCQYLKGLDLRGFTNCTALQSINSWFYNCHRLSYIDLSNFETSTNLKDSSFAFYYCSRYTGDNVRSTTAGAAIFAKGKWIFADDVTTDDNTFEYCRVNLYGLMYKNTNALWYDEANHKVSKSSFAGGIKYAKGDIRHFDIQKQGELIVCDDGQENIVNPETAGVRVVTGYFNDASSDYYRNWAKEHYADAENTIPSDSDEPPLITETEYKNFQPVENRMILKEIDPQTAKNSKKTFIFEYVTSETGKPAVNQENTYTVDETIYMTVCEVIEKNGKFYTSSQKYQYTQSVSAIWTKVTRNAPAQWYCRIKVNHADDMFFAWEDTVKGYSSTADEKTPVKTVGADDVPVITNSSEPVGSLELKKTLSGTESEKFTKDSFKFRVTMKNPDGTPYIIPPFNQDGIADFDVRPNAPEKDKIIIKGIPAGCTYQVEEISIPAGYENQTETNPSGIITENITQTAEIINSIVSANLSLTKQAKLYENNQEIISTDNTNYTEWIKEKFTFTVIFNNLVMGQNYSYVIYDAQGNQTQTGTITGNSQSADTVTQITLQHKQTITFQEIPIGTKYTIKEIPDFSAIEGITYETTYTVNPSSDEIQGCTAGEITLNSDQIVSFTNSKRIEKTEIPETIAVTINKKWYSANGEEIAWSTDENGTVTPSSGNFPSFLWIALGRALPYSYTDIDGSEKIIYLEDSPQFARYNLKAKENWSYTFTNLPKYKEITDTNGTTRELPYIYYVTEMSPIGYTNINSESIKINAIERLIVTENENHQYVFTLKNQEEETFQLSICKLVTGNLGNKTKEFTFQIEFRQNGELLKGTGLTVCFTNIYDNTYERKRTYTLENGRLSISLPNGGMIRFLSIPKGTNYTITETTVNGYETHSGTYTADDVTSLKITDFPVQNTQTADLISDTNYLYINDIAGEIPTGIVLPAGFLAIISVSIISILFFRCKAKRKIKINNKNP